MGRPCQERELATESEIDRHLANLYFAVFWRPWDPVASPRKVTPGKVASYVQVGQCRACSEEVNLLWLQSNVSKDQS